jgi:hypothetical protein
MGITVTPADVMAEFKGVASQELIGRSSKNPNQLCETLGNELSIAELGKASPVHTI